jgi:hypothetical protein
MVQNEPFEPAGQICPDCTCNNLLSATRCEVCGAPLRGRPAPPEPEPGDWTPEDELDDTGDALAVVASDERESLGHFPTDYEADLAAGLLRSRGIAVEIAPPLIWGGPRIIELWVNRRDAAQAFQILDEVNGGASHDEP